MDELWAKDLMAAALLKVQTQVSVKQTHIVRSTEISRTVREL